MKLIYHRGTILVKGEYSIPNTRWDSRSGCYRSQAFFYKDIVEYLEKSKVYLKDLFSCDIEIYDADDKKIYDPSNKTRFATPLRPAIYVE